MRLIWTIFAGLVVAMVVVLPRLGRQPSRPAPKQLPATQARYAVVGPAPATRADQARADSIVAFGLAQRGTPYVFAGTSPLTGFDCSGFILYTFGHFGVPIPHSTALLIDVGRPVARTEAQPGDIVVFTGTDKASTTPGHAGIVISRRGELPLQFVHASSSRREPFVKVSQVEDSDYERRFMQVRRVLGAGTGVVAAARVPAAGATSVATTARSTTPVTALPVRPVAVAEKAVPTAPLPKTLPKRPVSHRVRDHRPVIAHSLVAKAATVHKPAAKPVATLGAKSTAPRRAASPKKVASTKKRATNR